MEGREMRSEPNGQHRVNKKNWSEQEKVYLAQAWREHVDNTDKSGMAFWHDVAEDFNSRVLAWNPSLGVRKVDAVKTQFMDSMQKDMQRYARLRGQLEKGESEPEQDFHERVKQEFHRALGKEFKYDCVLGILMDHPKISGASARPSEEARGGRLPDPGTRAAPSGRGMMLQWEDKERLMASMERVQAHTCRLTKLLALDAARKYGLHVPDGTDPQQLVNDALSEPQWPETARVPLQVPAAAAPFPGPAESFPGGSAPPPEVVTGPSLEKQERVLDLMARIHNALLGSPNVKVTQPPFNELQVKVESLHEVLSGRGTLTTSWATIERWYSWLLYVSQEAAKFHSPFNATSSELEQQLRHYRKRDADNGFQTTAFKACRVPVPEASDLADEEGIRPNVDAVELSILHPVDPNEEDREDAAACA